MGRHHDLMAQTSGVVALNTLDVLMIVNALEHFGASFPGALTEYQSLATRVSDTVQMGNGATLSECVAVASSDTDPFGRAASMTRHPAGSALR